MVRIKKMLEPSTAIDLGLSARAVQILKQLDIKDVEELRDYNNTWHLILGADGIGRKTVANIACAAVNALINENNTENNVFGPGFSEEAITGFLNKFHGVGKGFQRDTVRRGIGRYCKGCNHWRKSMLQIVNAQIFCSNQSAGPKYTGAAFEYCPWCGGKLIVMK